MDRFLIKERKKSPKPPKQSGTSTNTVVGPGSLAEMDIDPRGGRSRSYQDLEVRLDRADLTMIPGERGSTGPRVVFQSESSGSQELPVPEASTPGVVDTSIGHGNDPTSECF